MTHDDALDRLARANPVPPGSLAAEPPPPVPSAVPLPRRRRVIGPVLAAAGVLGVLAIVAALIVAVPSDDRSPTEPAGALRVTLLDRPQVPGDRLDLTTGDVRRDIEPASVRLLLTRDGARWYAARIAGRPTSVCILQAGPQSRGLTAACDAGDPIGRAGIATGRWRTVDPADPSVRVTVIVGVVPDGISSATVGSTEAAVTGNAFFVAVRGRVPAYAVLQGPSASAIPRMPGTATVTPTGSPPAVAVPLASASAPPARAGGVPAVPAHPFTTGTLAAAAAASPFTVYAPASPTLPGAQRIQWSRHIPDVFPQVVMSWLPERAGRGVTIIEGPHRGRPGPRGRERAVHRGRRVLFVREGGGVPPEVRLVIGGTDVSVSGGLPLPGLLDVAASLRPVG